MTLSARGLSSDAVKNGALTSVDGGGRCHSSPVSASSSLHPPLIDVQSFSDRAPGPAAVSTDVHLVTARASSNRGRGETFSFEI